LGLGVNKYSFDDNRVLELKNKTSASLSSTYCTRHHYRQFIIAVTFFFFVVALVTMKKVMVLMVIMICWPFRLRL